jgi:addiction module HigA family antidote
MEQTRKPNHPAAILKHAIMDDRDLSVADTATMLGLTEDEMNDYLAEKTSCTFTLAKKLSTAFGTSVGLWLNMQAKLDVWNETYFKKLTKT